MIKQCTTCHFACVCREERFKALLEDTLRAHKTPDNGNYNWCDEDPCAWCVEASDLIYGGRASPARPPQSFLSSVEANQSPHQCPE
jgi:hypothetical protein